MVFADSVTVDAWVNMVITKKNRLEETSAFSVDFSPMFTPEGTQLLPEDVPDVLACQLPLIDSPHEPGFRKF